MYCHVAPVSSPITLTVPVFVTPSLLLLPVSVARARVGVATIVSTLYDALSATAVDVKTALLSAASFIVPLFITNALAPILTPFTSLSPACTV